VEPSSDAWNSYYAARFAWSDESSNLLCGVHQLVMPTEASRIESPQFVELDSVDRRTSILTGGLPFHRRVGFRKLDSLLIVRGETARKFRLAIGLDLPNPSATAAELLVPPTVVAMVAPPAPVRSGWLFHVSGRNVIATHWEPLLVEGRVEEVRVRLLETQGRPTRTTLRTFRAAVSARLLDFEDRPQGDLHVEADQVKLDFAAHEWLQVEVRFIEPSRSATV
jgi:alpha-mannosidase